MKLCLHFISAVRGGNVAWHLFWGCCWCSGYYFSETIPGTYMYSWCSVYFRMERDCAFLRLPNEVILQVLCHLTTSDVIIISRLESLSEVYIETPVLFAFLSVFFLNLGRWIKRKGFFTMSCFFLVSHMLLKHVTGRNWCVCSSNLFLLGLNKTPTLSHNMIRQIRDYLGGTTEEGGQCQ